MDLKVYNRVNREDLWEVRRMYDVGGKLLSEIKSMYVNSIACVRVKGGENKCCRIESDVKQGYACPFGLQLIYECSESRNWEDGSKVSGGGKRMEIAWSFVCRWLGFVW